MPARGEAFAEELWAKVSEIIAMLQGVSDDQWRLTCAAEGWPVGLVAFHIALGLERQGGWIENALDGGPVHEFSWDQTDEMNAAVAKAGILPSRQFVLAGLPAAADGLCTLLRSMSASDADMIALSYEGRDLSVQVIMRAFMRHIDEHGASVRKALAGVNSG